MNGAQLRDLFAREVLLADGGMGTALIAAGAPVGACLEALNVDDPASVTLVHRSFVKAGAKLVLTNTFGANRYRLEGHGMAHRVGELNRAGAELGRAAGTALVGGSVGPLGVRLAPYGRVSLDQAAAVFREQMSALAEGGVDIFAIETQSDLREAEQAVAAARACAPELAVVVSMTFTRDDRTLLGSTPEQVAVGLAELGVDAIGVNCGEGPAQALRVLRAMRTYVGDIPLMVRPNAGGPAEVGGRFVYPATPDYFAEHARAFLDEGVAIIGGCCGAGPTHISAMGLALSDHAPHVRLDVAERALEFDEPPATNAPPTGLERKLQAGGLVIAVEMEPPRSFSAATLVAAATTLRDVGADVIDVADSPMAKMRMSAWAACRLIEEQAGIETVLHFPTRGRNILRLQGDLLGAHALGIRNLFVCVGDPVTIGDYPQGSNNVDVTATGLLALITEGFNEGVDRAGSSIGEPTSFFAGAAVAPAASDLDREVRLLQKKVENGARFLLSQPLYSVEPILELRAAYRKVAGKDLSVPLIAGVLPLVTGRHAAFLHNEVPGIVIPAAVMDRMAGAGDDAAREGVAIAAELISGLRAEGIEGIYVMPQFGRYDLASDVVEAARAG